MLRSRFGAAGLLSDLLSRAREHATEQRHLRRRLVGALGGEQVLWFPCRDGTAPSGVMDSRGSSFYFHRRFGWDRTPARSR